MISIWGFRKQPTLSSRWNSITRFKYIMKCFSWHVFYPVVCSLDINVHSFNNWGLDGGQFKASSFQKCWYGSLKHLKDLITLVVRETKNATECSRPHLFTQCSLQYNKLFVPPRVDKLMVSLHWISSLTSLQTKETWHLLQKKMKAGYQACLLYRGCTATKTDTVNINSVTQCSSMLGTSSSYILLEP